MKNKKIREAIDYGDYPERMGRNLERTAGSEEGLYGTNPAMKKGPEDVERLIGDRFKKIVDHLRRVSGIPDISSKTVQDMLISEMYAGFSQIVRIENQYIPELEALALESAIDETEIGPNWYQFEIALNRGGIDMSKFKLRPDSQDDENDGDDEGDDDWWNPDAEPSSFDVEDLTPNEKLELEKHKRNIINAIIQGAAKKAHHLYEKPEIKAKLDAIDQRLYPLYRKTMAITDFMYFTLDEMIDRMSQTGSGIIGQNFLSTSDNDGDGDGEGDDNGDSTGTKIVANASMFPVLCHEIIKGIKEATGMLGLPKDVNMASKVLGQTDILKNEPIQMRMGPELYEKLRTLLPDEMYLDENKGLIPWFEGVLYETPAKQFLEIISNVVSNDQSKNKIAMNSFKEIMKKAIELKNDSDSYDNEGDSDDIDPDDIDISDIFK